MPFIIPLLIPLSELSDYPTFENFRAKSGSASLNFFSEFRLRLFHMVDDYAKDGGPGEV